MLDVISGWAGQRVPENSIAHLSFPPTASVASSATAGDSRPRRSDRGLGPAVIIPLVTADHVLGVLILLWSEETGRVPRDALDLAGSFASQAAVTLVLARPAASMSASPCTRTGIASHETCMISSSSGSSPRE